MKLPLKMMGILAMLIMVTMAAVPAGADTGKPSVAVTDLKVTPAVLMPGDTGTITITITNPSTSLTGSSTTQSDTYNFGTGSSNGEPVGHSMTTSTTSSTAPDGSVQLKEVTLQAISPLNVTSQSQFFDRGRLGMGNSMPFTFTFKVDNNVADGIYPMTLKIRTGDDGVYLNYPVSIQVDNSQLTAILNDAPKSFSTTRQTVVIDILNSRPNQVDDVSVIPSGGDFTFKPIQEYAVGSIGAGELYTVQFDVTAKNASYGGNPSFAIVYMNGQNKHQTDPITVYTDHKAAADTAAASNAGDNSLLYVLLIVVIAAVVIGGVFMYMKGKREKS